MMTEHSFYVLAKHNERVWTCKEITLHYANWSEHFWVMLLPTFLVALCVIPIYTRKHEDPECKMTTVSLFDRSSVLVRVLDWHAPGDVHYTDSAQSSDSIRGGYLVATEPSAFLSSFLSFSFFSYWHTSYSKGTPVSLQACQCEHHMRIPLLKKARSLRI